MNCKEDNRAMTWTDMRGNIHILNYREKGAKKTIKEKDMWLSIRSSEMMRDTMKALVAEIKGHGIEYESYGSQRRVYLHLKNVPATFDINNWIYYQPVSVLRSAPDISDYDRVDW